MSIRELVKCDYCGEEGARSLVAGWLEVDDFGIDVRHAGSVDRPRHYCGGKCLVVGEAGVYGLDVRVT